ncbi:hypothetical protein RB653_007776 [Dictyostelium firmibasis]|uniref:TRAF-type domain-containing protein n=1 Tax=Dictyostelium firmibasis TaxID=79012 RepID=A0AAN7TMD3_9MYCE
MEMADILFDDLVVGEINEDFICVICSHLQIDIYQCVEGHFACKNCFLKVIELKKSCMTCRCEIKSIESLSKNRYLEKEVRKLNIHCPNSFLDLKNCIKDENGCKDIITIDGLETHLKNCKFTLKECPNNKNCKDDGKDQPQQLCQKIRTGEFEKHLIDCPNSLIQCSYCSKEVFRSKEKNHIEDQCLKVLKQCEFCFTLIERGDFENHQNSICQSKLIRCPFSEGGCLELVKRSDIKNHLDNSSSEHILYSLTMINGLSLKLEKSNSELEESKSYAKLLKKDIRELKKLKRYSGKWVIEKWSEKLKQFGKGQSMPYQKFNISPSPSSPTFFTLRLFPNGEYNGESISIHLVKLYKNKSRISFSFEIENFINPSSNEEIDSRFLFGNLNDFYSTSFYKEYNQESGFVSEDDELVINFNVDILKYYDDTFITK